MVLSKNRYCIYGLGAIVVLGLFTNTVFAELTSMKTNNELFVKGDKVIFSGNVEDGSSGLVTIVIRDLNDEFVLLEQAIIDYDNTFEKSVIIDDKFTSYGIYTANGFILNMSKGISTEFIISSDELSILTSNEINEDETREIKKEQSNDHVLIKEPEPIPVESKPNYADFVDPSKDPAYYVERYYSEPTYKSWFDRNYPGQTIEYAVGYTDNIKEIKSKVQKIIENEVIPEAQASSMVEIVERSDNIPDIAQISLAVAALGILFGAVYGVKRQVDSNSKQILINKDTLRKKIIHPIIGGSPIDIIQTRLAKGEITLEEFELLKSKLD